MVNVVDPTKIENIVGCKRHSVKHMARLASREETVFILHSYECFVAGDILGCSFSIALENGIDNVRGAWEGYEDMPVAVEVTNNCSMPYLVPRHFKI